MDPEALRHAILAAADVDELEIEVRHEVIRELSDTNRAVAFAQAIVAGLAKRPGIRHVVLIAAGCEPVRFKNDVAPN